MLNLGTTLWPYLDIACSTKALHSQTPISLPTIHPIHFKRLLNGNIKAYDNEERHQPHLKIRVNRKEHCVHESVLSMREHKGVLIWLQLLFH